MPYWWVNHKQTFRQELGGEYIWSPTKNKDGSRNQTYLNLTKVQINDTVFSYAAGEIKAIGVVERECVESKKPEAFGKDGEHWDKNGYIVRVRWAALDQPFSPKDYLSAIVPLLPTKYSPIQHNGDGNQKFYLTHISDDLGGFLLSVAQRQNSNLDELLDDAKQAVLDDAEESTIRKLKIPETDKEQLIKARRGQGVFRNNLEKIEKGCRLTGVSDGRFLIASHLKPWRASDNVEKLDGNNGLLLSPHVDKLFDKGWISFSDKGRILCSNKAVVVLMKTWGLDPMMNVGLFNNYQNQYLDYHRSTIFKSMRKQANV